MTNHVQFSRSLFQRISTDSWSASQHCSGLNSRSVELDALDTFAGLQVSFLLACLFALFLHRVPNPFVKRDGETRFPSPTLEVKPDESVATISH